MLSSTDTLMGTGGAGGGSIGSSSAVPPSSSSAAVTTPSTATSSASSGLASSGAFSEPSTHPATWTESDVITFLTSKKIVNLTASHLGSFAENGISGEVLLQLDNESLKELGLNSVGQRLGILQAIFALKEKWGVPFEDGDWRPGTKSLSDSTYGLGAIDSQSLAALTTALRERDERVRALEHEVTRLGEHLVRFGNEFAVLCRQVGGIKSNALDSFTPYVPPRSLNGQDWLFFTPEHGLAPLHSPSAYGSAAGTPGASHLHAHAHSRSLSSALGQEQSQSLANGSGVGDAASAYGSNGRGYNPATPSTLLSEPGSAMSHMITPGAAAAVPTFAQQATSSVPITASALTPNDEEQYYGRQQHVSSASSQSQYMAQHIPYPQRSGHSDIASPGALSSFAGPEGESPTSSTPSATPTSAVSGMLSAKMAQTGPSLAGSTFSSASTPTAMTSLAGSTSTTPTSTPTTAESLAAAAQAAGSSASNGTSSASTRLASRSPASALGSGAASASTSRSSAAASAAAGSSSASSGSGSSDNPYKSFRVTLDDPCHKVLPAALKKYKINDDWRKYALFICYGSTERCLSYDEKPLLLFQKLKEARQNPVFMLRHIRDVKSPIAIANAKAAARKEKNKTGDSEKGGREGASKANGSGVRDGGEERGLSTSGSSATLSSGSKDADASSDAGGDQGRLVNSPVGRPNLVGPAAQLPPSSAPMRDFAIAIYPYASEREDEFDVGVGDLFVVLSKAKGWWVVQRDSQGWGKGDVFGVRTDDDENGPSGGEIRTAWVPAGCLLSVAKPIAEVLKREKEKVFGVSGEDPDGEGEDVQSLDGLHMDSVPIPYSVITSTSTPGVMLMEYRSPPPEPGSAISAGIQGGSTQGGTSSALSAGGASGSNAQGEASGVFFRKDERLRVFKRYNHWSYCVSEDAGGKRAWLPSWYIGKVNAGGGSSSSTSTTGGAASSGTGGNTAGVNSASATPTTASASAVERGDRGGGTSSVSAVFGNGGGGTTSGGPAGSSVTATGK